MSIDVMTMAPPSAMHECNSGLELPALRVLRSIPWLINRAALPSVVWHADLVVQQRPACNRVPGIGACDDSVRHAERGEHGEQRVQAGCAGAGLDSPEGVTGSVVDPFEGSR